MATGTPAAPRPRGPLAAIKRFMRALGAPEVPETPVVALGANTADDWDQLADPVTVASLNGTQNRPLQSRQQIYEKWQDMLADPIISSAIRLHVTAALGGHESKGKMVFIESTEDAKGNAADDKLVKDLAAELEPLFNRIAPPLCFAGVAFGDGYGRIYAEPNVGVRDVYTDELVYSPLVQPFEKGNVTIGFTVATSPRFHERLNVMQIARMKMPRMLYRPQTRVIEKSLRVSLKTDRVGDLPIMPSLAGGSFLDGIEGTYDKFTAAWAGLVGQRVQGSIDETLVSVNQTGMTPAQRKRFSASLTALFEKANAYVQQIVDAGRPVFGKIWHFIPTSNEKQLSQLQGASSVGRAENYSIEDVLMHAKLLAGSLGLDLSMLGFADLLSGGLGEGGFFRVSAQSAERSRMIRASLTECLDHIIAVHLLYSRGLDYTGQKKPWTINYFSGISALETERAKTKADAMNAAAVLIQTLAQLKDLRLPKDAMEHLIEVEMGIDAEAAKLYAEALDKAVAEAKKAEQQQAGFGGEGGDGDGGGMPFGAAGPGDEAPGKEPLVPAEG